VEQCLHFSCARRESAWLGSFGLATQLLAANPCTRTGVTRVAVVFR
jgi:hypothetical protein